MFCARLKETLKHRDEFIRQHGVQALIRSNEVSKRKYEEKYLNQCSHR